MQAFLTLILLGMKTCARTRLSVMFTARDGLLFDQDFNRFILKLDAEEAGRKRYRHRQFALMDNPGHRRSRFRPFSAAWGAT